MGDVTLPVLRAARPRRSRNARRRAIVLLVVQLLIVAHVVHWLWAGRTVSPLEPSESMEFVKRGVVNAGAIFFGIALLSTLVLGRWFCGWGCHMVMLQDFCGWLLRKIGLRPKPFRSRLLLWVPFAFALYMFVWPPVARYGVIPLSQRLHDSVEWIPALRDAPEWHGFSVEVTTADFWATFAGPLVAVPFLLVCGFATVYFLGMKGLCTYGCPYGGFFAPIDEYAPARIRVTDACEHCGHCTAACSSNVRVHEEVAAYGMVVDPGCLKCMDCVSVCPNDALYFGFGAPAVRKGPARKSYRAQRHDMTMGEEIAAAVIFLGSFLAFRGLYDLIPMLMAISMAVVTTFIAWKAWRVLRAPNVAFHRWRLRRQGRRTRAGTVALASAAVVVVFTLHSGVVQGSLALARVEDGRVRMSRAALFGPSPMELPEQMAPHADRALALYEFAASVTEGGIGLRTTAEIETRRAWLYACGHEFGVAEQILRHRMQRFGVTESGARDVTALLVVQLRDDEALEYALGIVGEHPQFVSLLDEVAVQLHERDRREEAVALCEAALLRLENERRRLLVMRRLSLLLLDLGRVDEAIRMIEATIEIDDTNPAAFAVLAQAYDLAGRAADAAAARERAQSLTNADSHH